MVIWFFVCLLIGDKTQGLLSPLYFHFEFWDRVFQHYKSSFLSLLNSWGHRHELLSHPGKLLKHTINICLPIRVILGIGIYPYHNLFFSYFYFLVSFIYLVIFTSPLWSTLRSLCFNYSFMNLKLLGYGVFLDSTIKLSYLQNI